ncbi:hypothetical protein CYMTET_16480, partial [Cymbomonas tetramitiformis]
MSLTFRLVFLCYILVLVDSGTPSDIDPQVANGSFEDDNTGTVAYVTTLSGWAVNGTCISVPDGTESWGSLSSEYGAAFIGIQGEGSYVAQTVTGLTASRNYWLALVTAARPGNPGARLALYINDVRIWVKSPSDAGFEVEGNNAFTVPGTTALIRLSNESPSGDYTVFVDFVVITDGNPKVLNGDFEAQDDVQYWRYINAVTGWNGAGSRMLIANGEAGSAWGGLDSGRQGPNPTKPPRPSGAYYVGLQDHSSWVEQTVHGLSPVGTYTVSFQAAARPATCGTCQWGGALALLVDGVRVWQAEPSNTSWLSYSHTFESAATHVTLRWENSSPYVVGEVNDKAVFLDNVQLPGTLLAGESSFESSGQSGCGLTSLPPWALSGSICRFANGASNTAGCTLDSYRGESYVSLEASGASITQIISGLAASETWILTWRMAACSSEASLALHVDGGRVWAGSPSTFAFDTGNYIHHATGADMEVKWVNESPRSTLPVYLDYLTFVKGALNFLSAQSRLP